MVTRRNPSSPKRNSSEGIGCTSALCVAWIDARFAELGRRGRHFAMQRIIEEVRDRGDLAFTPTDGGRFKISHNLRAMFTRLLCKAHPEYAHLVSTHHTVFDAILEEERDDCRRDE